MSVIVIVVVVLVLVGAAVGLYSRFGNDISAQPSDGLGHGDEGQAPGATLPDKLAGQDPDGEDPFATRGTR